MLSNRKREEIISDCKKYLNNCIEEGDIDYNFPFVSDRVAWLRQWKYISEEEYEEFRSLFCKALKESVKSLLDEDREEKSYD